MELQFSVVMSDGSVATVVLPGFEDATGVTLLNFDPNNWEIPSDLLVLVRGCRLVLCKCMFTDGTAVHFLACSEAAGAMPRSDSPPVASAGKHNQSQLFHARPRRHHLSEGHLH